MRCDVMSCDAMSYESCDVMSYAKVMSYEGMRCDVMSYKSCNVMSHAKGSWATSAAAS